ncbi:hypothetical protein AK812_SmicGene14344 [Symbiodinium microadriaticum]|uniref:Uncharacterized protein n=1 Tax=Symbiodinium microadriaticum TaxID=2951 RepID=A0A1Q9E5P7_SYMMI|nr:hypothetical protein AK812_SmicGene14344 [Symbiodinium microadriaticum]
MLSALVAAEPGALLHDLLEPHSRQALVAALAQVQSSSPAVPSRLVFKEGPVLYATFTGIKQDEDLTHAVAIGLEVRSLEGVQAQETSAWTYCLEQHLHGVLGLSNLLLSMVGLKPHKLQLNCLLSAAHQMLDQLQNVRRVRTLEPADPEPVDFVDLIDEVLFLVEASTDKAGMPIRKPGVEINSSIGKSYVPTAYNIVHNACRYTLSGTVTISGTHDREKPSEVGRGTEIVVTLRCTDEKPGISPISEAVFSLDQEVPFSRMYSTDRVGRTRPGSSNSSTLR